MVVHIEVLVDRTLVSEVMVEAHKSLKEVSEVVHIAVSEDRTPVSVALVEVRIAA